MIFFEPTPQFITWLVKHADKRVIYDCGSGEAHLLKLLIASRQRVIGIEPYWDIKEAYDPQLPVIPMCVQETSMLRKHTGLIVIARPDHSGWVEWIVENAHPESEILYISKPSNLEVDLPNSKYLQLKCPVCPVENVYQVQRDPSRKLTGRRARTPNEVMALLAL